MVDILWLSWAAQSEAQPVMRKFCSRPNTEIFADETQF